MLPCTTQIHVHMFIIRARVAVELSFQSQRRPGGGENTMLLEHACLDSSAPQNDFSSDTSRVFDCR